ncbi:unnamed protein product [Leptosia nina]|uniref:Uncharacterized protein n=1 Tax=Leptosia nina TaxID=320188 RepID=A0AAV1IWB8_9NEOP
MNCHDKRPQVSFKIDSSNPTKFNSLPRRKSSTYAEESFQRNTPARRSAGHADRCIEYFVPRSLSEFNLSGAGAGEFCAISTFGEKSRRDRRDKMVTFEDDRSVETGSALPDDVFM